MSDNRKKYILSLAPFMAMMGCSPGEMAAQPPVELDVPDPDEVLLYQAFAAGEGRKGTTLREADGFLAVIGTRDGKMVPVWGEPGRRKAKALAAITAEWVVRTNKPVVIIGGMADGSMDGFHEGMWVTTRHFLSAPVAVDVGNDVQLLIHAAWSSLSRRWAIRTDRFGGVDMAHLEEVP
jgi:hypothetical protein